MMDVSLSHGNSVGALDTGYFIVCVSHTVYSGQLARTDSGRVLNTCKVICISIMSQSETFLIIN